MAVVFDFIVVGSGMTAAHAAQTLVEGGEKVLMLDVGFKDDHYKNLVPDSDFLTIRASDENQHRYFLGDRLEGVPWGDTDHALTPPRQFMVRDVKKWAPTESATFNLMESLGYGGLGSGWGAGCAVYPDEELRQMGLKPHEMLEAYNVIADRIGVAAQHDDLVDYCSRGLRGILPPIAMDSSIKGVFDAYLKKRKRLNREGVFVGRTPMAVLTQDRNGRGGLQYKDMEFWADPDHSVYRSWMTVEKLKGESGFIYQPYCLVIGFTEEENQVRVEAIRTDTNESEVFFCRKLILAAGVFGTARIILRSFNSPEKLPILTNAYAITPCLHLRRLGRPLDHRKTSLGQLELFYDRQGDFHDVSMVTFYTYRSHMLFKLVKESPLNMPASLALMRSLSSALVLGTINHPDRVSDSKYLHRVEDNTRATKDRLNIIYELSEEEARRNSFVEKRILRAFRSLGLIPLSKQNLKPGSVVHYAGTLPFDDGRFPYSLQSGGRLRDSQRVYVADGSGFKYLPANGLTFTLMANAHLVAKGIMNGNEKMTPARKTKTIAITGANSMIGESLVRYFAGKGWAVRCLQRRPKNAAGDGITYHRFSLPDTIDEADIAGADVLVHCAVQYYDLKNRNADVVNDEGTQKLLDLTRKHSTKFIFISTLSAHEEAESHYGMNKFALEKKFDPQRDVVLRLGLVMAEGGLFTSIADIVKKAKFIPLFDNGKQPIQTLHIDDLCKVFETVIEKDMAGVFNVAEPQAHTMKDLHEAISRKLQLNRFFIPLPLRILQMVVSTIEALKVPFPFTSENTLGLKCMRAFETQSDLDRLGVTLRSMDESIDSLLQKSG